MYFHVCFLRMTSVNLAEIGDFIKEEYRDISYLRNLKILHEPNDDRLRRVMDFHKNHM